jgi:hypothetical protein
MIDQLWVHHDPVIKLLSNDAYRSAYNTFTQSHAFSDCTWPSVRIKISDTK